MVFYEQFRAIIAKSTFWREFFEKIRSSKIVFDFSKETVNLIPWTKSVDVDITVFAPLVATQVIVPWWTGSKLFMTSLDLMVDNPRLMFSLIIFDS